MASTSHSGQVRNSGSPSVIAVSSTKAPPAATAKPRFRSRTGCWTCRRRKVKCDERGRNPETVAYAGPLSSNAGCKRCEDSGRPCLGYGAQAPSAPLVTQYSPGNLHADPLLSSTPFYSFSSHGHESVSNSAPYSTAAVNVGAAACHIPHSTQWTRTFEQPPFPGSQSISYGLRNLRMAHNVQPSSGPTSTSGGSSLAPLHPSSAPLPPVDLRRYSVPSYPTWQRSSQPQNASQYPSGGLVGNALFQSSNEYENIEAEVHPLTHSSCVSERPQSLPHPSDCTVLPNDPYQALGSNDLPPHYNHDLNETEPQSLSFDFGRPHTSSGVSSSFDDPQSHQNHPKTYHSPINSNPSTLKSIEESERQYPDTASISSTTVCSDVTTNAWPEQQPGPASLIAFRPITSTNNNHSVISAAQNPLFPSQVNDSLNYHPRDGYQSVGTTDIPIFHDIPYDVYSGHPSLHAKPGSAEGRGSKPSERSAERSFHLVQMEASCHQTFSEMITPETHDNLGGPNCSYIRSCPLPTPAENEKDQVPPPRKGSSSSSSSSLSTQEHNVSPVTSTIRHSLPGISDKWSSNCFVPSLETHHYDFQSILHHNTSDCQKIGAYEDDSPTSTAPSNMSGAAGGN
ncbi:hypothetical protein PGT21_014121 [Puccinia graminis f. sp. tritici]|uniref:Zn(2)-C6 fungal-type domain-containing protein n=2 Tax=Puccinia graminis f. sp. tritici TaxID=56615 RepID=E3KMN6_PUCGT|nr:uncharacterized protein PGTG_11917 [Puccinia graminis f. sp. tritici CRL 75-36-700-3]EFP85561.2 hypothetical protein PGTG_11917 [Puccinia graminis f. sp. tritici CRL 75-36-700-3]KAA1074630.1 hypothetical protein PGT21_014121 [Puccinia graminis f. sp. tritici]